MVLTQERIASIWGKLPPAMSITEQAEAARAIAEKAKGIAKKAEEEHRRVQTDATKAEAEKTKVEAKRTDEVAASLENDAERERAAALGLIKSKDERETAELALLWAVFRFRAADTVPPPDVWCGLLRLTTDIGVRSPDLLEDAVIAYGSGWRREVAEGRAWPGIWDRANAQLLAMVEGSVARGFDLLHGLIGEHFPTAWQESSTDSHKSQQSSDEPTRKEGPNYSEGEPEDTPLTSEEGESDTEDRDPEDSTTRGRSDSGSRTGLDSQTRRRVVLSTAGRLLVHLRRPLKAPMQLAASEAIVITKESTGTTVEFSGKIIDDLNAGERAVYSVSGNALAMVRSSGNARKSEPLTTEVRLIIYDHEKEARLTPLPKLAITSKSHVILKRFESATINGPGRLQSWWCTCGREECAHKHRLDSWGPGVPLRLRAFIASAIQGSKVKQGSATKLTTRTALTGMLLAVLSDSMWGFYVPTGQARHQPARLRKELTEFPDKKQYRCAACLKWYGENFSEHNCNNERGPEPQHMDSRPAVIEALIIDGVQPALYKRVERYMCAKCEHYVEITSETLKQALDTLSEREREAAKKEIADRMEKLGELVDMTRLERAKIIDKFIREGRKSRTYKWCSCGEDKLPDKEYFLYVFRDSSQSGSHGGGDSTPVEIPPPSTAAEYLPAPEVADPNALETLLGRPMARAFKEFTTDPVEPMEAKDRASELASELLAVLNARHTAKEAHLDILLRLHDFLEAEVAPTLHPEDSSLEVLKAHIRSLGNPQGGRK